MHLSRKRQCQIVFAKNWKDDQYYFPKAVFPMYKWMKAFQGGIRILEGNKYPVFTAGAAIAHFPKTVSKFYHHSALAR